jgi:hypothetical protein
MITFTVYCVACSCTEDCVECATAAERDALAVEHASECTGRVGRWNEKYALC